MTQIFVKYILHLCIFRHLKLEIALAIPASNDEKENSYTSISGSWHAPRPGSQRVKYQTAIRFKNCCFVIHGALGTLSFWIIFGFCEGYYIRSHYYVLYLCSPLILTFLIILNLCLFLSVDRLYSKLSASSSALILLFYDRLQWRIQNVQEEGA